MNSDFNFFRLHLYAWSALKLKSEPEYFDMKQNGTIVVESWLNKWVLTSLDGVY